MRPNSSNTVNDKLKDGENKEKLTVDGNPIEMVEMNNNFN